MVTVTTTWNLSLTRIRDDESYPEAADLLNLCAFFDPDRIPLQMVMAGADQLPEPLSSTVGNELTLRKALAALLRYSLVTVDGQGVERALSVHRLVQEVARERLLDDEKGRWITTALQVAHESFPKTAMTFARGLLVAAWRRTPSRSLSTLRLRRSNWR
jgi:hypothetical protein